MSDKIINHRPLVYLAIVALITILLSSLSVLISVKLANIVIFCIAILLVVVLVLTISLKRLNLTVILSLSLVLMIGLSSIFISVVSKYNNSIIKGEQYFEGVIDNVKISITKDDKIERIVIASGSVNGEKLKVSLTVPTEYNVIVGNSVNFIGDFYKNSISFDGKFISSPLANKVFYRATNIKNLYISNEINGTFNKLKNRILNNLKVVLPNNYSIAYAMLTGDTALINTYVLQDFRSLGIAHVFAVSGLHIGFLYGVLLIVYKIFKLKGKAKLIISSSVLFLYVWFCGFSASCIRAFTIILVICFSDALLEKPDRLTALATSFIIVLLLNPFDFFQIGFQLSFAVYSSIVFLSKPLYKLLSNFCFDWLAKLLAPYLTAYFASIPLSIDAFSYVSAFSVLFNMALVPLLGFVYVLVVFLSIFSLFLPFYKIFAILPNIILDGVVRLLSLIDTNIFMIKDLVFGASKYPYYLIGIVNTDFINISKKIRIILTFILLLAFIITISYINIYI